MRKFGARREDFGKLCVAQRANSLRVPRALLKKTLTLHDDYPVISLMQIEDLGFCAKGEGPEFVRSHTVTADGSFPLNTSGGQLAVGQAGAAGGFLGLTEAVRQLTDTPLGAAVPNARIGLVSAAHVAPGLDGGRVSRGRRVGVVGPPAR
jgi:acetyl-CoA acetyltransferase